MTRCLPEVVASRQHLLRMLPPDVGVICAELGVFAGDFAADILYHLDPQELHLFDTWQGTIACGDQHGANMVWRDGELLYQSVLQRFAGDDRVVVHRKQTAQLVGCRVGKFDFVYVDANHDEHAVYWDLIAADQVLAEFGVLAGHDYGPQFPGVVNAVDRFCRVYPWRLWMVTEDGCPSFALRRR